MKQVKFDEVMDTGVDIVKAASEEAMMLFERFASLSFYYNEVNKKYYNVCPAFYKFKIQPFERLFEQLQERADDDDESSLFTEAEFDLETSFNKSLDMSEKGSPERQNTSGNVLGRMGTTRALDDEKTAKIDKIE